MFFRKIVPFIIMVLVVNTVIATEVRRIGITEFTDLSSPADEIISTIIQNSLALGLKREKDFAVSLISNTADDLSQARQEGIAQKLDIVVYGSYRREGRNFVILIQIYDILENETRMSRLYRGEFSRSIFDTVDVITESARQEIRRALPMLRTEEEIASAQARRRDVYEPKEVTIRREMRFSVGIMPQMVGFMYQRNEPTHHTAQRYEGSSSVLTPSLSMSFRLEWFRFSFSKGGMPWLPNFYQTRTTRNDAWRAGHTIAPSSADGIVLPSPLAESSELRGDFFFGSPQRLQWYASLGMGSLSFSPVPNMDSVRTPLLVFTGVGLSAKNWEVSLVAQVVPFSQGWRGLLPTDVVERESHGQTVYQINVPVVTVGGSYFFSPAFGMSAKLQFADFQSIFTEPHSQTTRRASLWGGAIEFTYRFQFGLGDG